MYTRILSIALLLASLPLLAFAPLREASSRQSKLAKGNQIGPFNVDRFGLVHIESRPQDLFGLITGLGGGVFQATSKLYDVAALKMTVTLKQVTVPATDNLPAKTRQKLTDMHATGQVRLVVRELDAAGKPLRKTVINCDRAVYTAAANNEDRGVLQLRGHVVTDSSDSTAIVPYHFEGDSCKVTFLSGGEYNIDIGQGTLTGQPNDAPSPQKESRP